MESDLGSYEDIMYRVFPVHPLLIPSIVKSILIEFSYSELKQLRLVCTSWEYEASGILKDKTQIRFRSSKQVENYVTDLDQNYCCESYEFGPEIPISSYPMQGFFDRFGCEIKSLKLHEVDWTGPELWDILYTKLPYLDELSVRIFIPRLNNFKLTPEPGMTLRGLKILKLNFLIEKPWKASPPPPREVTNPEILRDLLLAVPNIEQVYCPCWPTIIRPAVNVGSLFFNVIFDTPEIKFEKLSYIHINATLDSCEIFKLMEKNFPLKELRLELYPDVKPYCFYFLLQSLEATLKTLILIFHPNYDAENFDEFPTLKNLTYLSLHYYCGPIDVIVKYLPNLKTLLLNDYYVMDNSFGLNQPRFNLNQLEELIIEGRTCNRLGQLEILARNFPNLRKLKIQDVDDEMLRVIFKGLTNLEEFAADGKFTDAGLCGIPLEVCQNIFEVPDVDKVRIYPYIGSLRKLRRLALTSFAITYLSVLLGVNDCKYLKFKRISSPQILPVL